jgi:hypothetical protein
MMKKLVVAACLALGLSACGVEAPLEEAAESGSVHQQGTAPLSWVCGMDDCPAGQCATSVKQSTSCPGGYAYGCTVITPTSKCI